MITLKLTKRESAQIDKILDDSELRTAKKNTYEALAKVEKDAIEANEKKIREICKIDDKEKKEDFNIMTGKRITNFKYSESTTYLWKNIAETGIEDKDKLEELKAKKENHNTTTKWKIKSVNQMLTV